jgi:hypothetical protein
MRGSSHAINSTAAKIARMKAFIVPLSIVA